MESQDKTVKQEEQKEAENTLAADLAKFEGGPNEEQLETWKQRYGEVFCSGFSATEIFVWRPISRSEFIQLQVEMGQKEGATQWDLEEAMVALCVIWATQQGVDSLDKKAGSSTTIHEQIMQNSNFVNPAMAQALVIKL